ncbi:MAG: methyltransferase [Chloroflexi bacterium]|nr:methyltransferase [Chloroflexota bacterium]
MTDKNQPIPPPDALLMELVHGYMVSKALQAAAEIGIADLLADSPRTVEDLARATSTNPSALFRLLRALAARGIFRQNESGCFENTPLSEPMRSGSPDSVRDYLSYTPHDGNIRAWMRFMSVLQTGEPEFVAANGCDLWGYFRQHPDIGEQFDRAMTALTTRSNRVVQEEYDFSSIKTIIDIGGGQGLLLASLLKKYPQMRGALFELPAVVENAKGYIKTQGVADRCEFVAGDAFKSIPAGYDAYVYQHILHDWSDEKCAVLLERCREAIPANGKLIILDAVMAPGNEPHPSKWFDLYMMVALGGRERTEEDFRSLLRNAGFNLTLARPLPVPVGIVEAVPF